MTTYRTGVKIPKWDEVTESADVTPDEYNTDIGSLYRLRRDAGTPADKYSARDALALIKKYVGENNNTIFSNLKIMGYTVFMASDYAPLSETPFPDTDIAFLIVGTATVDMTETNFCVACRVEYCG